MERNLIKDFWNCGDRDSIDFAIKKANLNRLEREALHLILDECYTQEKASEILDISTRSLQEYWYSACDKLLNIEWVKIYSEQIKKSRI